MHELLHNGKRLYRFSGAHVEVVRDRAPDPMIKREIKIVRTRRGDLARIEYWHGHPQRYAKLLTEADLDAE